MIFTRLLKKYLKIISTSLAVIAMVWTPIEFLTYYKSDKFNFLDDIRILYLIIFIAILTGFIRNWPRNKFQSRLRLKDVLLEIRVGNIFKNKGAIILPINNNLDCNLDGNVLNSNSLICQFLKKYYSSDYEELEIELKKKMKGTTLEIGNVIEIEKRGKAFLFVVNSKRNNNNRVSSTLDDFVMTLGKLWEYIAKESGRYDYISIPLLNTGHGRITELSREIAIKEIINSFVEACKYYDVCPHLIISLNSRSVQKWKIDLDKIEEYLIAQCKFYRDIRFSDKKVGQEISESKIKELNL